MTFLSALQRAILCPRRCWPKNCAGVLDIHAYMTQDAWARAARPTDADLAELRVEIAATMDVHEQEHRKASRFQHLRFPKKVKSLKPSAVTKKMRLLRRPGTGAEHEIRTQEVPASETAAPVESTPVTAEAEKCGACQRRHRQDLAPQRFDSVEYSLEAIQDLACYLEKPPRTIWLALEGIFTARQTTSAPNLVRQQVSIFARLLPAVVIAILVALGVLHFLFPNHGAGQGYTPMFSELGFLLMLSLLTTITFFVLTAFMLLVRSTFQERFINGFNQLVNWSIPIVLSFFFVSPDFLALVQELFDGSSGDVATNESIFDRHVEIVETIAWTVLVYVSIYAGMFFTYIAFAKMFQEQRDYAHRHDVLRDVIPLLVADDQQRR